MDTEQEASEYLFNIYIEPWVKNFKGQRANTSSRLTPDVLIQCNSVREMKESLWGQFSNNLKGKAIIPSDLSIPCSVDASGVEPANIDRFFVFQKNNRPFLLNESFSMRNLHVFSSVNRSEPVPVEMIIYAYSDGITSGPSWDRFKKDCILPARTDRAGASNEESILTIQDRLRQRWAGEHLLLLHLFIYSFIF
jgi:hypothetical protein